MVPAGLAKAKAAMGNSGKTDLQVPSVRRLQAKIVRPTNAPNKGNNIVSI